jgi:hypothetical protein
VEHKGFQDQIRSPNREDTGNDHPQNKEHNFSLAEHYVPFAERLIDSASLFAFVRMVVGGRLK